MFEVNADVNQQIGVIEDSDCEDTGAVLLPQLQQCSSRSIVTVAAAIDAADDDRITREFLAALEMEFSSLSSCCSVVSVKKASIAVVSNCQAHSILCENLKLMYVCFYTLYFSLIQLVI